MCKTAIPQFLRNCTKNRAKPYHRKLLRPLQHDSSAFFYRHATVAPCRIPAELHRENLGGEGARERKKKNVAKKLATNRREPSVPIRTNK